MLQVRRLITALVALVSVCGIASAGWMPLTDMVPFSSLEGQSLIVTDKEFSDFDLLGFATGGAVAPDPDGLFVQGGVDEGSGDCGLRFSTSWNAATGQRVNAEISFVVKIIPGTSAEMIEDVSMVLLEASATGSGVVNASETVLAEEISPTPTILASLSCSKEHLDGGANLVAHGEFGPVTEIYVYKAISATGGMGEDGSAHVSGFYQYFSQVPEPATLLLIGVTVPLLLRRRRRG